MLAYYRDVENGRAVELKGSIGLDHETSISVKKAEICIKVCAAGCSGVRRVFYVIHMIDHPLTGTLPFAIEK